MSGRILLNLKFLTDETDLSAAAQKDTIAVAGIFGWLVPIAGSKERRCQGERLEIQSYEKKSVGRWQPTYICRWQSIAEKLTG